MGWRFSPQKSRLSISFIDIFPQLVLLKSLLGLECWRPAMAQHNWLGMIPLLKRDRWKFWWLQSLKNNSVQFLKDNYNNWNGYFSKFQDHSQSSVINQFMWNQSCLVSDGLQSQKLGSQHPADNCFAPQVFRTFSKLFFIWRIFCCLACECW